MRFCVIKPCLRQIPSWAVLLLSRSVMISAWMSLILLRSAARLYSICSIWVRGITCFSCTCVHKPWRCWTSFRKMHLYLESHLILYLPSSSSSGNKGGKGMANLPVPVSVEVFTSHQYANLKWMSQHIHLSEKTCMFLKIQKQHSLTSMLDVNALLTFAMIVTTFPTLEQTETHGSLYYQQGAVIMLSTQYYYWETWCPVKSSSSPFTCCVKIYGLSDIFIERVE